MSEAFRMERLYVLRDFFIGHDASAFAADIGSAIIEIDRLKEENDVLLALARRVHAECGPVVGKTKWGCPTCHSVDRDEHDPDCLWLAADALLKQSGEAKP